MEPFPSLTQWFYAQWYLWVDRSPPHHSSYLSLLCDIRNVCMFICVLTECLVGVQVRAFLQPPMQGVVLETYGSGNAPDNRPDLLEELKKATDAGVIIINCTQCLRGTVSTSYATGKVSHLLPLSSCKWFLFFSSVNLLLPCLHRCWSMLGWLPVGTWLQRLLCPSCPMSWPRKTSV